ncbi:hypothetical protein [Corynebacterium sp. LK2510]|uniref:hypothetical protein n=1 Tax=Corynebacterium sp. LK2510 TaxID=3110472 RepID=UPI0034CD76BB
MEAWVLDHPEYGRIVAEFGYDPEFAAREVAWPGSEDDEIRPVTADSSLSERITARMHNPALRLQVSVDGEVMGRFRRVRSGRIPLQLRKNPLEFSDNDMVADFSKPHLKIDTSILGEPINVEFRQGKEVVECDPSAGSRGAHRRAEMERSPIKRVLYPLAAGIGKSGWALAALILGPVIARFLARVLEWLLQFVPDWEITWPGIYLPVPDIPEIRLPVPSISMPTLPELPEWVKIVMDYQRLWVPILIAVVVAMVAVRNHSKSAKRRRQWESVGSGKEKPGSP